MSISEANLTALSTFADVADEYCKLIESLRTQRPSHFYRTLESLFARLHAAIAPVEMEMADEEHPEFEELELTEEQRQEVAQLIGQAVASESDELAEWYQDISDCDVTRAVMLWDDLTDIYRDLHDGLSLWRHGAGDFQAQAAWEWRFNYEEHWGLHLFRAAATVLDIRYRLLAD